MLRKVIRPVLSSSREGEIIDLAEAVAEEYAPDGRLNPVSIVEENGITLSFNGYGNSFDGMLEHRRGRFHIYCNIDRVEQIDSSRARFTLGHEIGHYFIDEHRNALASGKAPAHGSRCEYESDLLVEAEADLFASHLLMPSRQFLKLAHSSPIGLGGILHLSGKFAASVTSTAIRYVRSDLVPCAVLKWADQGLQWKWLSTETFRARFRKTVDRVDQLPWDCPTRKALTRTESPKMGFFEAGTTAAAWFPFVDHYHFRNIIFIEQAVSLGRFGVLTFLYPESGGLNC
ncbi:MAG: ImmA/IrrE family metallo-endopeptidase [Bacteroidota bacterium]